MEGGVGKAGRAVLATHTVLGMRTAVSFIPCGTPGTPLLLAIGELCPCVYMFIYLSLASHEIVTSMMSGAIAFLVGHLALGWVHAKLSVIIC